MRVEGIKGCKEIAGTPLTGAVRDCKGGRIGLVIGDRPEEILDGIPDGEPNKIESANCSRI